MDRNKFFDKFKLLSRTQYAKSSPSSLKLFLERSSSVKEFNWRMLDGNLNILFSHRFKMRSDFKCPISTGKPTNLFPDKFISFIYRKWIIESWGSLYVKKCVSLFLGKVIEVRYESWRKSVSPSPTGKHEIPAWIIFLEKENDYL